MASEGELQFCAAVRTEHGNVSVGCCMLDKCNAPEGLGDEADDPYGDYDDYDNYDYAYDDDADIDDDY